MTLDLDAIRARCNTATKGPWVRTDGLLSYDFATIVDADTLLVAHVNKQHNARDANIDFIAHSRADVPALVAEVERLRRELHDEQVRRSEWEKMYEELGLVVEPEPDATHCGHPREAVRGDVTCWCSQCQEEAEHENNK